MATKLYLHRGTTSDTGTLPAAGTSVDSFAPTQIAAGGDTNRSMDTTIGASAQTSVALTTLANQSLQTALLLRFCSAPLAAQTFDFNQTVTLGLAASESNTNSVFRIQIVLAVWRPGTGAVVTPRICEVGVAGTPTIAVSATSETWSTGAATPGSVTLSVAANDILVLEIWRDSSSQTMSTAYTNTVFYDGTTEASATNAAAYLNFANTITFAGAGTTYTKAGFGAEHA